MTAGPALAMLEIGDVPDGYAALDALAKEAVVEVHAAGTVQRGHFLLLFGGEVEATRRAWDRGLRAAGPAVVDRVLLPWADERILPAIVRQQRRWPAPGDTLGVLQLDSSPSMLAAVDRALKGALVDLVELRVADGLGGRSVASLWGETADVEAGLALAAEACEAAGVRAPLARIVRRADAEIERSLDRGSRFFGRFPA